MNDKSKILFFILLITTLKVYAAPKLLEDMYHEGDYEGFIENINTSQTNLSRTQKIYMAGKCQFHLSNFEKSIYFFEQLKNNEKVYPDINYLLGQSYLANNELKVAANYFKKSSLKNYKKDASLYYLGFIHKELGLFHQAKGFFDEIHQVSFPDLTFIQAAHHQTGILYLEGYVKTKTLSKKVIKDIVIPKFEKAILSAPNLPLAKIIKDDIKYIKTKYLQAQTESPINIRFSQFFDYNSNVIYQSVEPTDLNNSESGLYNSLLELSYNYKPSTKRGFQNILNLSLNHQYHLKQEDINVARYDGLGYSLFNQIRLNSPFKKKVAPIWINLLYRAQNMNNKLDGDLVFDNRSYQVSFGQQLQIWKLHPSYEISYSRYKNFTGLNNQTDYSFTFNLPLNFHRYLTFFLSTEMRINNFTNASELSNYQINNSLTHILKIGKKTTLTTRGLINITDTREMKESRGYEVLLSPQLRLDSQIFGFLHYGFHYKYEKKLSKDKETFSYDQHVGGLFLGLNYE